MTSMVVSGASVGLGAVLTGAAVLYRKSTLPSSMLFGPALLRGAESRRVIALTFDDGPSPSTARILELLQRYNARATFFQCGVNVRRFPEVAREVVRMGHCLGNHTDSHPRLWFQSPACIYRELLSAQETIQNVTGIRPRFFRPPFGIRWFGLKRAESRLRLVRVLWTAIGRDWVWQPEQIVPHLLNHACNGAIFCLHDGRGTSSNPDISTTVGALDALLPALIDRGYQFETLSEILMGEAVSGLI